MIEKRSFYMIDLISSNLRHLIAVCRVHLYIASKPTCTQRLGPPAHPPPLQLPALPRSSPHPPAPDSLARPTPRPRKTTTTRRRPRQCFPPITRRVKGGGGGGAYFGFRREDLALVPQAADELELTVLGRVPVGVFAMARFLLVCGLLFGRVYGLEFRVCVCVCVCLSVCVCACFCSERIIMI